MDRQRFDPNRIPSVTSPYRSKTRVFLYGRNAELDHVASKSANCSALRAVSLSPTLSNDIWRKFLLRLEDSLQSLFLDVDAD